MNAATLFLLCLILLCACGGSSVARGAAHGEMCPCAQGQTGAEHLARLVFPDPPRQWPACSSDIDSLLAQLADVTASARERGDIIALEQGRSYFERAEQVQTTASDQRACERALELTQEARQSIAIDCACGQ